MIQVARWDSGILFWSHWLGASVTFFVLEDNIQRFIYLKYYHSQRAVTL